MSKPRIRKDYWAPGFICSSLEPRAGRLISRNVRIIGTGDTMEEAFRNWKEKQK